MLTKVERFTVKIRLWVGNGIGPETTAPVAFTVFGKDIYWYGIIIAAGFLLAVFYMLARAKDFGITQDDVLDMILWAVPIGVVCARLYYCIFYWELYADDPISILYIWDGGYLMYVLSFIFQIRSGNADNTQRHSHCYHPPVKAVVCRNVSAIAIAKRRYVF